MLIPWLRQNIFPGNYLKYLRSDETLRVSEATVSRCIDAFLAVMTPHYSEIIGYSSKPEEVAKTQQEFFTIAGLKLSEFPLLICIYATWSYFKFQVKFPPVSIFLLSWKGFPRVVGTVDGLHFHIATPSGPDAVQFINRKYFHSINLQVLKGSGTVNVCYCYNSVKQILFAHEVKQSLTFSVITLIRS